MNAFTDPKSGPTDTTGRQLPLIVGVSVTSVVPVTVSIVLVVNLYCLNHRRDALLTIHPDDAEKRGLPTHTSDARDPQYYPGLPLEAIQPLENPRCDPDPQHGSSPLCFNMIRILVHLNTVKIRLCLNML